MNIYVTWSFIDFYIRPDKLYLEVSVSLKFKKLKQIHFRVKHSKEDD